MANGSREAAKGARALGCSRAETLRGAQKAELAAGALFLRKGVEGRNEGRMMIRADSG